MTKRYIKQIQIAYRKINGEEKNGFLLHFIQQKVFNLNHSRRNTRRDQACKMRIEFYYVDYVLVIQLLFFMQSRIQKSDACLAML